MLKKIGGLVVGFSPVYAFAALPASVQTAITAAQDDGETLGYALLVMAIVVGLVFWLKRKGSN